MKLNVKKETKILFKNMTKKMYTKEETKFFTKNYQSMYVRGTKEGYKQGLEAGANEIIRLIIEKKEFNDKSLDESFKQMKDSSIVRSNLYANIIKKEVSFEFSDVLKKLFLKK